MKHIEISSTYRGSEIYKTPVEMNIYVPEGLFKAPEKGPLSESP